MNESKSEWTVACSIHIQHLPQHLLLDRAWTHLLGMVQARETLCEEDNDYNKLSTLEKEDMTWIVLTGVTATSYPGEEAACPTHAALSVIITRQLKYLPLRADHTLNDHRKTPLSSSKLTRRAHAHTHTHHTYNNLSQYQNEKWK